ncbi:MAG: glycosyltransferase [Bacteroidetes bacterium]|nr:glycosyltransferase [Bacteroidota bacterium]
MPVYNGERYLRDSIESVLHQTYTDFEFLIINDGSTDRSVEIIETYNDQRIRLVSNEKNLQLIATLNKGLTLAQGEYIARMDCDDISLPHRLMKQVDFMELNTDVGLCGSWLEQFSEKGMRVWKVPYRDAEIRCEMLFNSVVYHPTVMIRKKILDDYSLCYENFVHAEDYALWTRIMDRCKVANIPEVLVRYRQHTGQIVNVYMQEKMASADSIRELQLNGLGIIPTKEEMTIHHNLSYSVSAGTIGYAQDVGTWLTALLGKNNVYKKYDSKYFDYLLHQKWFWTCNSLTHFGFPVWKLYRSSPVCKNYSLSLYQKIKFFIKMLIRYSK